MRYLKRNAMACSLLLTAGTVARAQQPAAPVMGSVAISDAKLAGGLEVAGSKAQLVSNASITALDHTAPIDLVRGGQVLVCSTSQFHLLHSGVGQSLLFGLDRGAIEIHSKTAADDMILTPDLRFTLETGGTLNLSLRVTPNGDTCVDNAGANAPTMLLNDSFSAAVYRLTPGQHVLFEHGSLREVVDSETSSCGCPEPTPIPDSVAATASTALTPAQRAALEHPFPAAASQGLASTPAPAVPPKAPAESAGQAHAQISTTLTYTPGQPPPAASAPSGEMPVSTTGELPAYASASGKGTDQGPPPPAPPAPKDFFHAIGRFFHKIFHPGDKKTSTPPVAEK